jgi:hypothetical protein
LRTAAGSGEDSHSRTKSSKTKNQPAYNGRTNERPNKYLERSAAFNQVAKKVASNTAKHGTNHSRNL